MSEKIIVWDFDGVLNANIVEGRFVWADTLMEDWGIALSALADHLFHPDRIGRVMRGQVDLRAELVAWLDMAGHDVDADAFMAYWFAKDALPDAEVLQHLNRPGARHVIGTNNEPRRADYIETQMGFGARVAHIFASGRIGHAKPDPEYFAHIEDWSGAPVSAHVLIDDTRRNVDAARSRGWDAFHFTDQTRADLGTFLDRLT
ncbi:HAD-IA family hydrolase [Tateyamaria omphalii]|uniref:HAD family hydrolase n=1 Tax=Tateyamaria omphalii TaxID=299262 RepID=UPI001C998408|nr:HAD-IA family hydrolase [Tateyamaria omphalii]MBY5931793.1 HAD-IA family hydrolase [Tateyamaria omphalii]